VIDSVLMPSWRCLRWADRRD